MNSVLTISDRGQITIPKALRDQLGTNTILCRSIKGNQIVLEPLQTKEDFFLELDKAEQDWEKNGGSTLQQLKKKYKL